MEPSGVGRLIRAARERAGLSQAQLARLVGTAQPTIAIVESDRRLPSVRSLTRMVSATGLDLVVGLRDRDRVVVLGTLTLDGRRARFDAIPDDGSTL